MRFRPLIGAARLAIGRGDGILSFGDTPQAFLASLAPLVAFPLVGAALLLLGGEEDGTLTTLLMTLVAQMAPAVLSHALAVRWGRGDAWLRYATAFNWCQWAVPVAAFVLLLAVQAAMGLGVPDQVAATGFVIALAGYGLWLHWVIARSGLGLSAARSALLVLLVNAGTLLLVLGPHAVQAALNGSEG